MAKMLVVDDSWVARLGMSRLLASLGHEVAEASDGATALKLILENPPAAVFLDLLMPGLDGFGVLKSLAEQGCHVPVFVLSADIQQTTTARCLELGARDCLPEPPTREVLEASLRSLA
jgi:CheY-like chemotaxis protein